MRQVTRNLHIIDRPHLPDADHSEIDLYKEWYHFNWLDDHTGIGAVLNVNFSGDIYSPDSGDANVVLLVHDPNHGWRGGIDNFAATAMRLEADTVELSLGATHVSFRQDQYVIHSELRDASVSVDSVLRPMAEPMVVWSDTPLGSGHINWLIVPWLESDLRMRLDGREVSLRNVRGYHDHNWGSWLWGEDFGWEWGFSAAVTSVADGRKLSVVYDRTTNKQGGIIKEETLGIWLDDRLAKLFFRNSLGCRRIGRFDGRRVQRLPGVMGLLYQGQVTSIPEKLEIWAAEGRDWIEATYTVRAATQITIPSDLGFGAVDLNETLGTLTVTGFIEGLPVSGVGQACFEFLL